MSQSRKFSILEAALNTASGMMISILAGLAVYPLFGYDIPLAKVTGITIVFTVISVIRSYLWRRFFNHLHILGLGHHRPARRVKGSCSNES